MSVQMIGQPNERSLLVMNCVDDWTAKRAIIASNVRLFFPENCMEMKTNLDEGCLPGTSQWSEFISMVLSSDECLKIHYKVRKHSCRMHL